MVSREHFLERDFSDTPRNRSRGARNIQFAPRIKGRAHVREHVFHFFAFEKTSAEDAIRDAKRKERFFQGTRLEILSVEHRYLVRLRTRLDQFSRALCDEPRFIEIVPCSVEDYRFSYFIFRKQFFRFSAHVLFDDGVRGRKDGSRRTVVLFQKNRFRGGKFRFEIEHELHVGASPRIDVLVSVADDA